MEMRNCWKVFRGQGSRQQPRIREMINQSTWFNWHTVPSWLSVDRWSFHIISSHTTESQSKTPTPANSSQIQIKLSIYIYDDSLNRSHSLYANFEFYVRFAFDCGAILVLFCLFLIFFLPCLVLFCVFVWWDVKTNDNLNQIVRTIIMLSVQYVLTTSDSIFFSFGNEWCNVLFISIYNWN